MEVDEGRGAWGFISSQLAIAFGGVSVVVLAMCAMLLVEVRAVSDLVSDMQRSEAAVRQSFELAAAVREQYIHMAHGVVEGDRSHVDHYITWHQRILDRVRTLEGIAPASERWRIEQVASLSEGAHVRFMESLLPAVERQDRPTIVAEHRLIQRDTQLASEHADAIATAIESRMADTHRAATNATARAFLMGAMCVTFVVGLSIFFIIRLRRAVLVPLRKLAEAAQVFGEGDASFRVGPVGRGELLAVARAFDRMAEEISNRQAQILKSERMAAVGRVAAGIAHELNNPIAIIRGYLKTMEPTGDVETLGEELRILDEEAERCQRIAEDLLTYARPKELHYEAVEMKPLLDEVAERLASTTEDAGVHLAVQASEGRIEGDPLRLRQVFLNLLLNAQQASPPDGPIEIVGRSLPEGYEVSIADRGRGITEDDRRHIFEPFFTTRGDGTGLGLAVVHGIVRAHQGEIEVNAREGGGTTFTIRLPASRQAR